MTLPAPEHGRVEHHSDYLRRWWGGRGGAASDTTVTHGVWQARRRERRRKEGIIELMCWAHAKLLHPYYFHMLQALNLIPSPDSCFHRIESGNIVTDKALIETKAGDRNSILQCYLLAPARVSSTQILSGPATVGSVSFHYTALVRVVWGILFHVASGGSGFSPVGAKVR